LAAEGDSAKILISKFSKRFHLAGIKYINDLMFAKTLVFQAFSKFLFGGFVGFQRLVVEKIWKTRYFQKSPAWPANQFPCSAFPWSPVGRSSKRGALFNDATENLECPEIVSLKRKMNRRAADHSRSARRFGEPCHCAACHAAIRLSRTFAASAAASRFVAKDVSEQL